MTDSKRMWIGMTTVVLWGAATAVATTYYVDFEGGADANTGTSEVSAFKRCPGDPEATATAKGVILKPGDKVFFKGGAAYQGAVKVAASGEEGNPIVFDGGAWGNERAVIHGGTPMTGWKKCTSADEARGNPKWEQIYYADIPKLKSFKELNLCDSSGSLPIAQHPNPKDFFWQESHDSYLVGVGILEPVCGVTLSPESGTNENKGQPLSNLLTGNPAVVTPVPGCAFTYTLPTPAKIKAVGIALQPNYSHPKDVTILGDGKELLKFSLAEDEKGTLQKFDLPSPATVTKLTFQFHSMHEPDKKWSKLKQVAAFASDGQNVIKGAESMTFADPENLAKLSGKDADWFDGMTFAFHAGNNEIFYLEVKGYDPEEGALTLPAFGAGQYKQTKYCFFNSVKLIDEPGECSVGAGPSAGTSRIFLLPRMVADDQPEGVFRAVRANGLLLDKASHVVIQNLIIRQQNNTGVNAKGPAQGIVCRDTEVTQIKGESAVAISASQIDGMISERVNVHDNLGHTKGIVYHTCKNSAIRDSKAVRNTSTAIDYYVCSDSVVAGNTVLENRGSHANGLTFYVGCKNITVENNYVAEGNNAVTFSEGEGYIFRNNLLSGSLRSMVVGIWPHPPLKNVQFFHNTIVQGVPDSVWQVGLFSNARKIEGLVVKNNIIDGVCSDHDVFRGHDFSNNLYTRTGKDQASGPLGKDEKVETDLKKIFVAPDKGDFRLKEGSPAIGMGVDVGVRKDVDGRPRHADKAPDVGAYQFAPGS